MLQLRVFGDSTAMTEVVERLDALSGIRHLSQTEAGRDGSVLVTADVRADAADSALALLRGLRVPEDDVALLRMDVVAPIAREGEAVALIWSDLLGQARVNTRTAVRYLVLMAVAGVIAAFGVIGNDQVLIVGAMAVSPDLLPITATCTGLVLRRGRLVRRGLVTLLVGLGVAGLTAAGVSAFLDLFNLLPKHFSLHELGFAAQQHVSAETIMVALAAGIAGMLALETRASSAVGVAISVTTIPASAFLGVALGIGQASKSLSALAVLGANIAMMLVGGTGALLVQRAASRRGEAAATDG